MGDGRTIDSRWVLERQDFNKLFEALAGRGYRVVGPAARDGAIVYDEIKSDRDLPEGWTDEQGPGRYRLRRREDKALFGYNVGPHAWKKFLNPPASRLWSAKRENGGFSIVPENDHPPRLAFLGVRSCELSAIQIQDKVFVGGAFKDAGYRIRRERVFIVAVNCGQAGGTCFCVSMKTGPKAAAGFDLAMTEVLEGGRHFFLVEVGGDRGEAVLDKLQCRPANEEEIRLAERRVAEAAGQMGRSVDTAGIKELLYHNAEHPRWQETAERCLSCANCTLACPTCFCSSVEDVTDLSGDHAERWRKWDSCFTVNFSHLHGGGVRSSVKSRYRQWLTHKVAAWIDQFGTSGCVGCGRCIAWCPAGIDLTEEIRAMRDSAQTVRKE